jgi:hypothetical protein
MLNDTCAPAASVAAVHVTVVGEALHPALAETNCMPVGIGSVITTVVALAGPLFVTVS